MISQRSSDILVTAEQQERFRAEGYLVVEEVVPERLCKAVVEAICEFEGIRPDDADGWYQKDRAGHGIIPLHHHQALWDVRQHPALHQVFASLYGRQDLWVSMDRVSFKPAWRDSSSHWQQSSVHWDCDPWQFNRLSIQGLVYLTDTSAEQGAFACVPDIYRALPAYLDQHAKNEKRRQPVYEPDQLVPVPAPAGSLILFNRLMPHTSLLNHSDTCRFVQYVAMEPVSDQNPEKQRQSQIQQWQELRPPAWAVNQKVPGQLMPEPWPVPKLTALGRRLVGVELWEEQAKHAD